MKMSIKSVYLTSSQFNKFAEYWKDEQRNTSSHFQKYAENIKDKETEREKGTHTRMYKRKERGIQGEREG
jgi:hypothetical protein